MTDAPKPARKTLGNRAAVFVLVGVFAFIGLFVFVASMLDANRDGELVKAEDYGREWPWPDRAEGRISCKPRTIEGKHAGMAIIKFGDKEYGLNSPAFDGGGYVDARLIATFENKVERLNGLGRIAQRANRLCKDLDPLYFN